MRAAAVVANILKREGVEFLIGYPVNPIIEAAAEVDIRTIIVRQERRSAHGGRGEPHDVGRAHRSLRHAAQAGRGEFLRRRCAGVRRFRADRGAA
jgi:hypothetical protein